MKQFLFCICLVFSQMPSTVLAGESVPCAPLSSVQKHAIAGAVLAVAGIATIVGSNFGTLGNRCPIFNAWGEITSYKGPLYCCNVSGTSITDCSLAFGLCVPESSTACYVFLIPGNVQSQRVFQPAQKHPSDEANAGFALGGIALIIGTIWSAAGIMSALFCS